MIKRLVVVAAIAAGAAAMGGGWVAAQTPAAKAKPTAPAGRPGPGMMGMGGGMMGWGMHGMPGMGMGGMCPMAMAGADTKIDVKNVDKGVTITITSTDPGTVTRLQKMAEATRLMHEAMQP